MNLYEESKEAVAIAKKLIKGKVGVDLFEDLRDANAKIGCQFKYGERDEKGRIKPSIKEAGFPAVAKVAITSAQHRAYGVPDAVIQIDKNIWNKQSDESKEAIIAHFLYRIEVQVGGGGTAQIDACDRPVMKLRRHDYRVGIYTEILNAYGEHSLESIAIKDYEENREPQLELCFRAKEDDGQFQKEVDDVTSTLKVVRNYSEADLEQAGKKMIETSRGTMNVLGRLFPELSTKDHTQMMDDLAQMGVIASEPEEGETFREVLIGAWDERIEKAG